MASRGGRYYDPFATLAFFAACTERIRLLTHVLVLPYHHPLEVAKRAGTLDTLSAGRVVLGVGVGSLEEEFDLLGVEFRDRGARYEDGLRALRSSLGQRQPAYAGTHYRFADFVIDPAAVQARVPIWIGGRSLRSLRRALVFGDGWDPFRYTCDELEALLPQARAWRVWQERTEPFDVVLSPETPLDAISAQGAEAARRAAARYKAAGATILNLRFRSASIDEYVEQLEAFATRIAPEF